MGRSIKKGPFVDHHLMDKIVKAKDAKSKADVRMQEEMAKLTGGLQLPPGFKLPF